MLFVILGTAGITTAFAIGTITLAGDVQVDGNLNVDGQITGPTITDLQSQIDSSAAVLSCENQIAIANHIFDFRVDPECITGHDMGISLVGPNTFGLLTITATITNNGPDPNIGKGEVIVESQSNVINDPIPAGCNRLDVSRFVCRVLPVLSGESFSFEYEVNHTVDKPGFVITSASLNNADNRSPNNENDSTNNVDIIQQPL